MLNHKSYWDKEWRSQEIDEYQSYLESHMHSHPWFLEAFRKYEIKYVCDAACGFGAYSAMLSSNGFQVSGFDLSSVAVDLTKQLLRKNRLQFSNFIASDICAIEFPDDCFDATVAHAVLDHLSAKDASIALCELMRITKPNGLVYLSFDPLEQEDLSEPHDILEDGSFLYTRGEREGLLFRYNSSADILRQLMPYRMLQWRCNKRGEREFLLQKLGKLNDCAQ